MTRKERIARQRILAIEAFAKLRAVGELFGVEDSDDPHSTRDFDFWDGKVTDFEEQLITHGPIG